MPQSAGFPPSIFEEAAAAAGALQKHRRLDVPAAASGGAGAAEEGVAAEQQGQQPSGGGRVPGGTVAELLGRMAAGRLVLRPHKVRATPRLSAAAAAAADSGGPASLEHYTAELDVKVAVRAAAVPSAHQPAPAAGGSEGSAAGGGCAPAAAAAGEERAEAAGEAETAAEVAVGGLAGSLRYTRQDQVLFQPSLVAASGEVCAQAQAACRAAAAAGGVAAAGAFDAALAALREAGAAGLSLRQLASALHQAGGSKGAGAGAALPARRQVGQRLAEHLLLHGLARAVCSFEGKRYAAAEHSQALLAFPHLPLPQPSAPAAAPAQLAGSGAHHPQQQEGGQQEQEEEQGGQAGEQRLREWRQSMAREVGRLAAALGLPAGGRLQPCLDVPLRPWVDHHGRLNSRLWEALVRKALAAAARQPGARGGQQGRGGWRGNPALSRLACCSLQPAPAAMPPPKP